MSYEPHTKTHADSKLNASLITEWTDGSGNKLASATKRDLAVERRCWNHNKIHQLKQIVAEFEAMQEQPDE